MKEKYADVYQRNVQFGQELHQKELDLEAAELSIKKNKELALIEQNQREEELQKNLDLQTSLQNQREKECQEIRDLQVSLQVEREARKKEAAAYEEVLKVHQTNMTRTDELITTLPEALLPAVKQRLLDLRLLIDAHISPEDKWIYTEKPSEW